MFMLHESAKYNYDNSNVIAKYGYYHKMLSVCLSSIITTTRGWIKIITIVVKDIAMTTDQCECACVVSVEKDDQTSCRNTRMATMFSPSGAEAEPEMTSW